MKTPRATFCDAIVPTAVLNTAPPSSWRARCPNRALAGLPVGLTGVVGLTCDRRVGRTVASVRFPPVKNFMGCRPELARENLNTVLISEFLIRPPSPCLCAFFFSFSTAKSGLWKRESYVANVLLFAAGPVRDILCIFVPQAVRRLVKISPSPAVLSCWLRYAF